MAQCKHIEQPLGPIYKMKQIVIGSRGSALALTQTNWIADKIKLHNPGIETRIEIIRTKGDKILDTPLSKIGDKGLFVKEIELALADGRIDLAVHSMKDLPSEMMDGLVLGAVPARVDPCDVLLSNKGYLKDLPEGARIGSSSLRRKAQILHHRPNLEFHDLRGNLDTRIKKLQNGDFDAIILAYAGLFRLGLIGDDSGRAKAVEGCCSIEMIDKLPFDICLPAVGQGALAIEIRENDEKVAGLVAPIDDSASRAAVTAERALLAVLGGGCQVPIAAIAASDGENLIIDALVASIDGKRLVRTHKSDKLNNAKSLGEQAAMALLESGAREILLDVREEAGPTSMGAA